MSNYDWVCFSCRMAVRRPSDAPDVKCPSCGEACDCIGYKLRIPPKTREKDWETLRQSYHRFEQERRSLQERTRRFHIHYLETEIARLDALPPNDGRKTAVKQLKKRLEKCRG